MMGLLRPRLAVRRTLLALVLVAVVAAGWFLYYGGRYLQHEDPLQKSDAIFVLAGTRAERPLEAVDLLQGRLRPHRHPQPGHRGKRRGPAPEAWRSISAAGRAPARGARAIRDSAGGRPLDRWLRRQYGSGSQPPSRHRPGPRLAAGHHRDLEVPHAARGVRLPARPEGDGRASDHAGNPVRSRPIRRGGGVTGATSAMPSANGRSCSRIVWVCRDNSYITEANGARWPSRSSKSVASRVEREGWVRLPGASANLRSLDNGSMSFGCKPSEG